MGRKRQRVPVSPKRLWRNLRMEEEAMRVTVLGAVTIIAAIIIAGVLLRALQAKGNQEPDQGKTQ